MSDDISQRQVYLMGESLTILAYKGSKQVLVDIEELTWRNDADEEFGEHLLLSDISDQLIKLGYDRVFYVWSELGLSGSIYMYGNYDPPEWMEHGTTRGYA